MSPLSDLQALEKRLREQGTLSELLNPQDFALEGMVADTMAYEFKGKLKPTQMRKVFHSLKRIERNMRGKRDSDPLDSKQRTEISLLFPNLAYAVGRGLLPEPFYNALKLCLSTDKIRTVADFRRLIQLLTAILAYQKYYEKS